MKLRRAMIVAACSALLSGCGSVHMFEETHTHIEKRAVLDTDDAAVSMLVNMINRCREAAEPREGPLQGFEWDEKILTKYEGEDEDE